MELRAAEWDRENWRIVAGRLKCMQVYRELLEEPVMAALMKLFDAALARDESGYLRAYGELSFRLTSEGFFRIGPWLEGKLRVSDASWPRCVAAGIPDTFLKSRAAYDLDTLSALATHFLAFVFNPGKEFLSPEAFAAFGDAPALCGADGFGDPAECGCFYDLRDWENFYLSNGCGVFTQYRAFLWENGELLPVPDPDVPAQSELLGYRRQRQQVEENTRSLLAGNRVNNVLLFGESGTGKSATVKSLLGLPGTEDLRLIEIEKSGASQMPRLIRSLDGRRQKFILFIDDLAFDEDDMNYSVLKTILEGGLEPRPDNVAIYATSNRRNLVRQTFSSRAGDEVDRDETIQEKTALADRFGLRIPYLGLAKGEYLELVDHLADRAGLTLPKEELHAQAVRWDVRHPGRSPRTAQQFIASLQ